MDLKETAAVLSVLKVAYPQYYNNGDTGMVVKLWQSMLSEYPASEVNPVIKSLIATNKYPPTIAEVIERINLLTKPPELGEVEAWGLVKQAIRNSTYHSREEYDKLPESIQRTLGSPDVLREWAMSEEESTETVIASQFMRSYRAKNDNRKTVESIPASVKALMIENDIKSIEPL